MVRCLRFESKDVQPCVSLTHQSQTLHAGNMPALKYTLNITQESCTGLMQGDKIL